MKKRIFFGSVTGEARGSAGAAKEGIRQNVWLTKNSLLIEIGIQFFLSERKRENKTIQTSFF